MKEKSNFGWLWWLIGIYIGTVLLSFLLIMATTAIKMMREIWLVV